MRRSVVGVLLWSLFAILAGFGGNSSAGPGPIPVGIEPRGVAFAPDGSVAYVTNHGDGTVSVINTATHAVVLPIFVGGTPWSVAFTPDGRKAYVGQDGQVSVIDTATHTVTNTIPVDSGFAADVAISPDGRKAYVTNGGREPTYDQARVSVIDTDKETVTKIIDIPGLGWPNPRRAWAVAFAPDGSKAYVSCYYSGEVAVIDTATEEVTRYITVRDGPADIAFTPDGSFAYVANWADVYVSVIDVASDTLDHNLNIGEMQVYGLAVSPDGREVYVANAVQGTVVVIDTASQTVTDAIPVGIEPHGVAFAPDGPVAYVTNSGDGTVSVIERAGARTIHVATTGSDETGDGSPENPYRTIQKGIDEAALAGDTVRVHAGTYHENIVWDLKSLSLIGDGAGSTIVDGDTDGDGTGNGPCLTVTNVSEEARVEGFTFQNGSAYEGGGLYLDNSDLTVANNVITGNTAGYGGGLWLEVSAATLTGNTVTGNTADFGGGLCLYGSAATLTGNTVTGNTAYSSGGLWLWYSAATLTGNTVTGNTADLHGGGLALISSAAWLNRNLVSSNETYGNGGGIFLYGSDGALLTNNLVSVNVAAENGSGMYLAGSDAILTNNTVADNGGEGVVADADDPGAPTITNCILWNNGGDGDLVNASATYSDIGMGNTAGTGNISVDPQFVGGEDYHLQPGSPCINAGNNAAPGLPVTDKDGQPRLLGTAVDMGAYEWQGTTNHSPVANAGPDQTVEQTHAAGTQVTLDGSGSSDPDDDPLTYSWTWPGGSATGETPTVTLPLGLTTVTLVVNDGDEDSAPDTVDLTVVDTTSPTLQLPADLTGVEQTSAGGAYVDFTVTATDACDAAPTVVCTPPSGSEFPLGTTTVNGTATDASGNTAMGSFTVTVVDTTPPTVEAGLDLEFIQGETVLLPAPTVSDVCDAAPVVTDDRPPTFPVGATTVTFTAEDASGNVGTDALVVTVITAQEAIRHVQARFIDLPLTAREKGYLNARLNAAISSLNKGQRLAAINQLQQFIWNVQQFAASGRLTGPVAADLVARGQRIIAAVRAQGVP